MIELEEKIRYFTEIAYDAASKEAAKIISDHKDKLDQELKEYMTAKTEAANTLVSASRTKALRDMNRQVSEEQGKLRRDHIEQQMRYKAQLFQEVKEKADAFRKRPEYTKYLTEKIEEAKEYAGDSTLHIYISTEDADKQEELFKASGIKQEISEDDFLGGLLSIIPDKNILIDHTFKSNMAKLEKNFHFEITSGDGGQKS